MPYFKRCAAEFAGTFCLVLFGTGSVILNNQTHGIVGQSGISAAFGLSVITMILVFGNLSGAHINPAVTLGFAVAGLFNRSLILPYLIAQFAGAALASALLKLCFPADINMGGTLPSGSAMQSFIIEIALSFFLMLVILITSRGFKEKGYLAAMAIGVTVFLEAYFAGPITGASMNPARSFGPAIVSGQMRFLWIYLTAPVIGASLASFVRHDKLFAVK